MKAAVWGAGVAGALLVAGVAWTSMPVARDATPPAENAAAHQRVALSDRPVHRTLLPDAERAGQISGKLAELRLHLARAGVAERDGCRSGELADAAGAFANARVDADHADWAALGRVLDGALSDTRGCDAEEARPVVGKLRQWRLEEPV